VVRVGKTGVTERHADGHRTAESEATTDSVPVTVRTGDYETTLQADRGTVLRDLLLEHGLSPYGSVSRITNCGGRGLCGTCGVEFEGEAPTPEHWHDRAAATFGYPRLSCQIRVDAPLTVRLPEKVLWGQLRPGGE
jgi:ferredoxin